MNELIVVRKEIIGNGEVNAVDARELHAFLEVGKDFSNWIKGRIDQYGFQKGNDYEVFTQTGENPQGGRPSIEYALSLDMAKELAMVERNEKGKQARQYFIECEKRLMGLSTQLTPAQMLLAQAQQMVDMERVQSEQAKQIDSVATRLDQIETATQHFTVIGYFGLMGKRGLPLNEAQLHGKKLAIICRERDLAMGKIPDPRFGTVNSYPKFLLDEYFEDASA